MTLCSKVLEQSSVVSGSTLWTWASTSGVVIFFMKGSMYLELNSFVSLFSACGKPFIHPLSVQTDSACPDWFCLCKILKNLVGLSCMCWKLFRETRGSSTGLS